MEESELMEEMAKAIDEAIQANYRGLFTPEDIARYVQDKNPDVIRWIGDKLGYSPEDSFAWLQARIKGILNKVAVASVNDIANASRNNPRDN
jgi:hypothetical protein